MKRNKLYWTSFVLVAVLTLTALYLWNVLASEDRARTKAEVEWGKAHASTDLVRERIASLGKSAHTPENYDEIAKLAAGLPADESALIIRQVSLAKVELLANERDALLAGAAANFAADKDDPMVKEYVDQGRKIQNEIDTLLSALKESPEGCVWNGPLASRKGYEHYRDIAFIPDGQDTQGKVLDALQASLAEYKKALLCYPKDTAIEQSIEFLYKKQKQNGGGGGKKPFQPRYFPQPSASSGYSTSGRPSLY